MIHTCIKFVFATFLSLYFFAGVFIVLLLARLTLTLASVMIVVILSHHYPRPECPLQNQAR